MIRDPTVALNFLQSDLFAISIYKSQLFYFANLSYTISIFPRDITKRKLGVEQSISIRVSFYEVYKSSVINMSAIWINLFPKYIHHERGD